MAWLEKFVFLVSLGRDELFRFTAFLESFEPIKGFLKISIDKDTHIEDFFILDIAFDDTS